MFNLPADKEGHIRLGLLLGMAFANHLYFAIGIVLFIAIGKEVFDYIAARFFGLLHSPEILDAIATIAGGAVGIAIVNLIDLIFYYI